jgi:GTP pyrophosphokinase
MEAPGAFTARTVPAVITPSLLAGADHARPFWPEILGSAFSPAEVELFTQALEYSQPLYMDQHLSTGEPAGRHVQEVARILATLRVDIDTLVAGTLYALPDYVEDYKENIQATFNPAVAHLVEGVARMSRIRMLGAGRTIAADRAVQVEALRKMLLAMAEDIRVVVIALAERLQTMRYVAVNGIDGKERFARETLDIFSPLANRLGLWQLKWELEDLSFRIIEPERYKQIAGLLEETRLSRERYVASLVEVLQRELAEAGIKAEVTGRPKHIYSIYKKMKRKDVDFNMINDTRATRILVDEVKDCYTALGVVHNLWEPIPKEFDDYIAKPKGNDYRSLHTTVTGPEGKMVEVQIRTHEMHRHSEMGVAAHWRYKEGAKRDARHDEKIAWLRQILEWKSDVEDAGELAEHFKTALFEEFVYVLTPQGKVIALPNGSTPLDFAYHIHSDLGHHCRGAKVDDVMVPLDYQLRNAQRVEIISTRQGGPSRDWLNPALGYLKSSHARSKVRQWFARQEREQLLMQGRSVVTRELQRHGMTTLALEKLAGRFGFVKLDEFLLSAGRGDINNRQLEAVLRAENGSSAQGPQGPKGLLDTKGPKGPQGPAVSPKIKSPSPSSSENILIVGVDKLLTMLAKCCKPAPPDPIVGFVTRGRGVTIHRQGCVSLLRLSEESPERIIKADWGVSSDGRYPVDIEIQALDRQGLLRDISNILAREKIDVTATRTRSEDVTAFLQFTLKIADLVQLQRVLGLIQNIPGIRLARRK